MARTEMVVAVSLLTVPKKAWLLLFAGPSQTHGTANFSS
jgi:hypothetical protein